MKAKNRSKFMILGCPDDLGVRNVHGRPGAAGGPVAFREFWNKINGMVPLRENCLLDEDATIGANLEQNHVNVASRIAEMLDKNKAAKLILIGGGHDYAAPWIEAYARSGVTLGCINFDAHFDVRSDQPVMTSGSGFYRAIERGWILPKNFIEFGIQDHANAPALWEYARAKKIRTVRWSEIRNGKGDRKAVSKFKKELQLLSKKVDVILISLDLDSLSFAFCPGVSSPQAEGFTASEVNQILEIAGAHKKVKSLGVFELAPNLEATQLTARFAAQTVWHFLAATSE